jgi:hypothetical protein
MEGLQVFNLGWIVKGKRLFVGITRIPFQKSKYFDPHHQSID